jgi:hypothetical protein
MTRSRDVADTQDNLGGAVAPYVGGKNFVIGGGFDWWQRGTTFVNPSAIYTADRWNNSVGGATITRQSTGAPSGSQYFMRTTSTSSSSFTDYAHYFETSQIAPLWGKTATFSFKIRKGTAVDFAGNFIMRLQKSSTVDAGSGATWTTVIDGNANTSAIAAGTSSSDWSTFSFTGTIPNDGTANSLRFVAGFGSGQVSGVIIDLAQVQLEIGSVATPFSRAGGSIGAELALCQRYYFRNGGLASYTALGNGTAESSTIIEIQVAAPVTMRTLPTAVDYSTIAVQPYGTGTITAVTSAVLGTVKGLNPLNVTLNVASGLTQGVWYRALTNNSTSGYLAFSAEL